jgi:TniQ
MRYDLVRHIPPHDRELLTGYLVRAAALTGINAAGFTRRDPRIARTWLRDVDSGTDATLLAAIGHALGRDGEWATQLTLRPILAFAPPNIAGSLPLVTRLGIRSTGRTGTGLAICPECVHAGRSWCVDSRLAFSVMCPDHQTDFIDACPTCAAPFAPHLVVDGRAQCAACGYHFAQRGVSRPVHADADLLATQQWLRYATTSESGWHILLSLREVLRAVRHRIMSWFPLASTAHALPLVRALNRTSWPGRIEIARIRHRRDVLRALAPWRDAAPAQFLALCTALGFSKRAFTTSAHVSLERWLPSVWRQIPDGAPRHRHRIADVPRGTSRQVASANRALLRAGFRA